MHGTPFVSRKGGRNDRWKKRGRAEAEISREEEELPGREAEDDVIISAPTPLKGLFLARTGILLPPREQRLIPRRVPLVA